MSAHHYFYQGTGSVYKLKKKHGLCVFSAFRKSHFVSYFFQVALRTLLSLGAVVHDQMALALRAIWSLLALLPLSQQPM